MAKKVFNILNASFTSGGSELLDLYPGAIGGYSLRLLSSTYTVTDTDAGSDTFGQTDAFLIQVRRASDNGIRSFIASEITDGTLESWVGAGNAFLTKWYDQSGTDNHLFQTTAADQPVIVSSGSVFISTSGQNRPSADFFNGNKFMLANDSVTLDFTGSHCIFTSFEQNVNGPNNDRDRQILFTKGRTQSNATFAGISPYSFYLNGDADVYIYRLAQETPPDYRSSLISAQNTTTSWLNNIKLVTCRWDGTQDPGSQMVYVDGSFNDSTQMSFPDLTTNTDFLCLGQDFTRSNGQETRRGFWGNIQEFLIYPFDTADRSNIETNLINYYH